MSALSAALRHLKLCTSKGLHPARPHILPIFTKLQKCPTFSLTQVSGRFNLVENSLYSRYTSPDDQANGLMTRRTLRIAPAIALALFALNQGAAQAGFVSTDLACVRGETSLVNLDTSGAGSTAPESPDPQLLEQLRVRPQEGAPTRSFSLSSTGGMSTPTPDQAGGTPAAAVLTADVQRQTQLSIWLADDARAWLPVPLSTGIFRPPRFVG